MVWICGEVVVGIHQLVRPTFSRTGRTVYKCENGILTKPYCGLRRRLGSLPERRSYCTHFIMQYLNWLLLLVSNGRVLRISEARTFWLLCITDGYPIPRLSLNSTCTRNCSSLSTLSSRLLLRQTARSFLQCIFLRAI